MKSYLIGAYGGPSGGSYIEREIKASDNKEAINLFLISHNQDIEDISDQLKEHDIVFVREIILIALKNGQTKWVLKYEE